MPLPHPRVRFRGIVAVSPFTVTLGSLTMSSVAWEAIWPSVHDQLAPPYHSSTLVIRLSSSRAFTVKVICLSDPRAWIVRLPEDSVVLVPLPDSVSCGGVLSGRRSKIAVACSKPLMVMLHALPGPELAQFAQPLNDDRVSAVGVSVTMAPSGNVVVQVPGHDRPPGPSTRPLPVPLTVTFSWSSARTVTSRSALSVAPS